MQLLLTLGVIIVNSKNLRTGNEVLMEPQIKTWITSAFGRAGHLSKLIVTLIFSMTLFGTHESHAATWPVDNLWRPVTQAGGFLGDIIGDGGTNGREIVGDNLFPAVYIYNDGIDFFVRVRLDSDPLQAVNNLRALGWGVLFDTDGDFTAYENLLLVDGNGEEIAFAQNTSPGNTGDPNDNAELDLYTVASDYSARV